MWLRFLKLSALLIVVQFAFWVGLLGLVFGFSARLDKLLDVALLLYYPTIKFIEMQGHFVGDSNIIIPIYGGILLGIPVYGIVAAALVVLAKRRGGRSQGALENKSGSA